MSLFARRRKDPGPPPSVPGTAEGPAESLTERDFRIEGERLASRVPSVHFTVYIRGTWEPRGSGPSEHHAPAALARHHLREYAARSLMRHTVLERTAAQDTVNAVIARPLSPEPGLVVHGTACLKVTDSDRALAEEHLRHEQRDDLEREDTSRRIAFLQAVLSDPDRRTVWWIDQYPDRLDDLDKMSQAVKNLNPPHDSGHHSVRDEVARFVDQLLTDIHTPEQREIFLRALTQTLRALGSTELQRTAARWLSTVSPDAGGTTP